MGRGGAQAPVEAGMGSRGEGAYGSRTEATSVRGRTTVWLLAAAILGFGPGAVEGQVVQGRVLSSEGDAPLVQASVSVVDSVGNVLASVVTGASGFFRFELEAGTEAVHLQAQALGFLTFFDGPVPLDAAAPVEVELRLQPAPITLDSLSVSVERRVRSLEENGFYSRERLGAGFHIDRTAIQRQVSAIDLADVLRTIPGVSVGNQGQVTFQGARSVQGCDPNVYLDGALVVSALAPDPFWARNLIDPSEVEGVEVYRRTAEVPVQYSASGVCGVVLIWSRR